MSLQLFAIGDSVLWTRPLYVQRAASSRAVCARCEQNI